ncbi:galactosyl transferase GMA12/MNN10 family-domain-containing protein [Copromyces sp. CBS 386.78]|nr:galactosyl transferase GMA12/MNN10 family-domain-containing protein [Copromyces sp. CBS 386.78]
MHFAYPPRKSSNPPPFRPRTSALPTIRSRRLKTIALAFLAFLTLVWLFQRGGSRRHAPPAYHKPSGNPPAVIVTVFNEGKYGKGYLDTVKENRLKYAEKHGYGTFFVKASDYDLRGAPISWASLPAVRHAMTMFPDASYIWYLDQNSFIMNPNLKIEEHVMKPSRLEELMIKDHPVVPPDSIIKTFSHLKGHDVDFVLTQDKDGLSSSSFVVKNGEWAKFFIETWFDPIYRSYNFQKAEQHALEHIVQWHPTILAKLALVPQRILNSYSKEKGGQEYKEGDIVVRLYACGEAGEDTCETESQRFAQWKAAFQNS